MRIAGNQKGQMVVESVLIMVVFMAFTLMAAKFFREKDVLKQLITGPWVALSGVLQNGVWIAPAKGAVSHPNGHTRHITIQGESAR